MEWPQLYNAVKALMSQKGENCAYIISLYGGDVLFGKIQKVGQHKDLGNVVLIYTPEKLIETIYPKDIKKICAISQEELQEIQGMRGI